eukprot:SAG31_NODE_2559_length_5487_cov_68.463066_1_plen_521_part_00
MAEICTGQEFLAGAEALWRAPAEELRLTEQIPIRTDPWPHGHPEAPKPGTQGYHCDFIFQRHHFHATPRQTYFQTFSIFSEGGVDHGGGCTMVIPASHHRTIALAEKTDGSPAALEALRQRLGATATLETRQTCIDEFGIDPADGVEITAPEGALVVFCPFCLHSSSPNHGKVPRYVVIQSFQHYAAAELLRNTLVKRRYLKGFHQDTHDALATLAPPLRQLLRGKHLWGEAMRKELCAFKERGFFLSPDTLIPIETIEKIDRLQCEVEPEWRATEWPTGMNILACQCLMVLRRGGEELLALMEQPQTLTLAASLLELGTVQDLVIEACDCGDALLLDDYPEMRVEGEDPDGEPAAQLQWHSDGEAGLNHVAFRTAIDPQGTGTPNASLRLLPGTHLRPRNEVAVELSALVSQHVMNRQPDASQKVYALHPAEVRMPLAYGQTLVWNPTTWHATERQQLNVKRRAFGWNYGVRADTFAGARVRDAAAVRYIFDGEWQTWSEARKKLWGVWEDDMTTTARM